ncbi:outer membrane protein assembly factor BamD [Maritalea porphyrae]|uniref:Outer membrane protein assembly factor BamD n=1 Tax=Maritalea porphyrae TaxID=880732 RepID=A0ABQ5UUM0_9HYPH|nr:outer membrane protein assembly factor BamD [Maritalea porphyrae]GLQ18964.1 outer membrane protein assembly factor BamD [Maritalea porphyrae]
MGIERMLRALKSSFRLTSVLLLALALSGCSAFSLFGEKKIVEEEIIPAEELYDKAISQVEDQRYLSAQKTFDKLERQHPYSEYSERSRLMTVYIAARTGQYQKTILAADRFLALYPSSQDAPYAMYMKGAAQYNQMKDITRDQQTAEDAIATFQAIINNFPNSRYAKDAKERILIAKDQLAGKEMSVGRYYLGNNNYTAAINRFRTVVEDHQTSTHVEEALLRLTEAYLALGLVNEAKTAAAVLGHNYPSSRWYEDAYKLLQKQGLAPEVESGNWLSNR